MYVRAVKRRGQIMVLEKSQDKEPGGTDTLCGTTAGGFEEFQIASGISAVLQMFGILRTSCLVDASTPKDLTRCQFPRELEFDPPDIMFGISEVDFPPSSWKTRSGA